MGLSREKIEYGEIRKFFSKRRNRYRTFLKKSMNRWIRRKGKKIEEDSVAAIQREYKGWEF
jgi:thymidylate kinase